MFFITDGAAGQPHQGQNVNCAGVEADPKRLSRSFSTVRLLSATEFGVVRCPTHSPNVKGSDPHVADA